MRIRKILSIITIALSSIVIISCDDTMNSIGSNIQPDGDGIIVGVDTVSMTAKTVSMNDSVYARTFFPLVGQYDDAIFGRVKSDYLTELYCPTVINFQPKTVSIDSVFVELSSFGFSGDSITPMGISIYEVTKSSLDADFFTNIDPTKYANMNQTLGQNIFTIKDLASTNNVKTIRTKLSNSFGQRFYNEWKRPGSKTFTNSDNLRQFFKGMYVTTTFGSGSLLNIGRTRLAIYYSYTGRNIANTADSTRTDVFDLSATPEVIQMNHIKNSIPESLFTNFNTKTYSKTPAGVYTEFTIPLKEIMDKTGGTKSINSAAFILKGFTEDEVNSKLNRPSRLLLINKDSITDFFKGRNRNLQNKNSITHFIIKRDATTNTYSFGNSLSSAISFYANYYKGKENIPDLKYLIIPIDESTMTVPTNTGGTTTVTNAVFNQMNPTSAIFRTDVVNMKLPLVFSQYKQSR